MKRSGHPLRRRGGFVMVVAIVLLGLVGATLAVMGTLFVGEAKRVRTGQAETQLRQLLIVGEAEARERVTSGQAATTQPVDVKLSAELQGAKLTLSGDAGHMRVEAAYQGMRMGQAIEYVRDGARWKIGRVTLD